MRGKPRSVLRTAPDWLARELRAFEKSQRAHHIDTLRAGTARGPGQCFVRVRPSIAPDCFTCELRGFEKSQRAHDIDALQAGTARGPGQ